MARSGEGGAWQAIAVAVEQVASKPSPLSYVLFQPTGGAYADLGPDDTAFGGPRTGYGVYAIGLTRTREELPAEREWIRSLWQALLPHARGIGSYVTAMVELEPDRIRASYGPAKYARLAEIKHRYDPDNLFHHRLSRAAPGRQLVARGRADLDGARSAECRSGRRRARSWSA